MRWMRWLVAAIFGAMLGIAVFSLSVWLMTPAPLWREELASDTQVMALAPEGDLVFFSQPVAKKNPRARHVHCRDAATGQLRHSWSCREEFHLAVAARGGKLRLLYRDPPAKLTTLDGRTGAVSEDDLAPGLYSACKLTADGERCVYLRSVEESGSTRWELARRTIDTGLTESWPLPEPGVFDEATLCPVGDFVAWIGKRLRVPEGGPALDRLWVAHLPTGRIQSFPQPWLGKENPGGDLRHLRRLGESGVVQTNVMWPPNTELQTYFDLHAGEWLPATKPGQAAPPLDGSFSRLTAVGSPSAFPTGSPRLPGSAAEGDLAIAIWPTSVRPPSAPELLVLPTMESQYLGHARFIDEERLALSVRRLHVPEMWQRIVGKILGPAWAEPHMRQGVRVFNVKERRWEWERFGTPLASPRGGAETQVFFAGGRLVLKQGVFPVGFIAVNSSNSQEHFVEAWDCPPAAWRSWLPSVLAFLVGVLVFLAVLGRKDRLKAELQRGGAA